MIMRLKKGDEKQLNQIDTSAKKNFNVNVKRMTASREGKATEHKRLYYVHNITNGQS